MQEKLQEILKYSEYALNCFSKDSIKRLETKIITKENKNHQKIYYTNCPIRNKEIRLSPEEIVRLLYIDKLISEYDYKKEDIEVEVSLQKGRNKYKPKAKESQEDGKERVDILIYYKEAPYIVVELKKPKVKDGKKQLESYLRYLNAPLGVLCNGDTIEEFYNNKEDLKHKTSKLEKLSALPKSFESLDEFLEKKYTLKDLYINDELQYKGKNLKKIIKEFEDIILANSGVDSFEEIFKLIFTKLFDEAESVEDNDEIYFKCKDKSFRNYEEMIHYIKTIDDTNFRILEFRNSGDNESFRKRINALFNRAKEKWKGIFEEKSGFELTTEELRISVSYLQDIKLFNSNLEVIDDAFEYLVTKGQKGDKGQYFTPRYVIDMCVKMLNPKKSEFMIDTASGSCGFPMHCILYVWNKIDPEFGYLMTNKKRTKEQKEYVKKVFAIDFDKKSVRIGRLLNLIAGDGEQNVLLLNSLHFKQWKNDAKVGNWESIYFKGFENLENLCTDTQNTEKYEKNYKNFNFDIVMANPPFAGDITSENLYKEYELGKNKISRDILFIERNLNMLKPGGRMAIVLPQGRFNNQSDKYIREFIAHEARILAVVGLHQNVFKPHTGTKTSVLFLQKWGGEDEKGEELCPRQEDYNIFFATMNEPSKDNSGDKIYYKDKNNKPLVDSHGHLVVKHDLFNPHLEGDAPIRQKSEDDLSFQKRTQEYEQKCEAYKDIQKDGIAEAFIEFAKSENLSFWRE